MASQETELTSTDRNFHGTDSHPTELGKRNENGKDIDDGFSDNEGPKTDETLHALSGLYAQIVVVVAAILVFTELLHGPVSLFFFHGYIFTFLVGGGILCFFGAYIIMISSKCNCSKDDFDSRDISKFSTQFMKNLFFSDISIYLRIGSVVFGLGALIFSGLEMASVFTGPSDCVDHLNLIQPILRGLFIFLQMHFLFMSTKEMVSSFRWFRHIALMHLVATNLAMWIRFMLWESAYAWLEAEHHKHNSSIEWDLAKFNITVHTLESDSKHTDHEKHKPYHRIHVVSSRDCNWNTHLESNKTEGLLAYHLCIQNSTIGALFEKAMPYLYSFNVQYCLVAAAVLYTTWFNLRNQRQKFKRFAAVSVYGREQTDDEVNCAGSTRGLFLGLLVLVSGIIALIIYFVLAQDKDFNVLILIGSFECGIFGISTLAAVVGLLQIRKMKGKTSKQQRLSEFLQRIGLLAVYIYGICNMIVGGVMIGNAQYFVLFVHGTLMVIQACLQSLFIHQVSKKRLSPLNLNEKPGRQVVIFLVFSNVVLWVLESFTTPNNVRNEMQLKFFGEVAWAVISKLVLPFVIFYRFHSAVALMEAWRKSYKVKQN